MTTIGMIIFPGLTQLDLTGPYEVFSRLPDTRVLLISEKGIPLVSDGGLRFVPDLALEASPELDILFVPGGRGVFEAMQSEKLLEFLSDRGSKAKFVTSVCTGALVLGVAGLLKGYRATTHWLSMDLLGLCGAEATQQRVVIDRNRITAAGVSAGIDFGLEVAARLFGTGTAEEIQLMMEYDPEPAFHAGSPRTADGALVSKIRDDRRQIQLDRRDMMTKIFLSRENRQTAQGMTSFS